MTLSEILPTIQELPRADKLRLIQLLAAELMREEDALSAWGNQTVALWSPHDAFEGAATLLEVLNQDKADD